MKYADQIGVKHVVVIGSEELKSDKYTFRDMQSGDQELLGQDELVQKLLM
jgi:histidyl-tRNA synthetase